MSSFFSKESPATRFLTGLCNLILLNLCFIISSIPIITIGASMSAMYNVLFAYYNHDEVLVFHDYFVAFGKAFKRATIVWVPVFALLSFFMFEIYILFFEIDSNTFIIQIPDMVMKLSQIPVWFMIFALLIVVIYYFPIVALFDDGIKLSLKNSLLLGLSSFPTTLLIIILQLVLIFIATTNGSVLIIVGSLLFFCGFSLDAFVCTYFLKRVIYKEDEKTKEYFKQLKEEEKAMKIRKKAEKIRKKNE